MSETVQIGDKQFELVDVSDYTGFGKPGYYILKLVKPQTKDSE